MQWPAVSKESNKSNSNPVYGHTLKSWQYFWKITAFILAYIQNDPAPIHNKNKKHKKQFLVEMLKMVT
jgi:hypothetical protein